MSQQIRGFGSNDDVITQVDPTYDAARVSIRPYEFASDQQGVIGGHYYISGQSGLMAANIASAADVFHMMWRDPTKQLILKKFTVQASTCTGFAATALGAPLSLFIAHGATAAGSGGGTIAPTNGNKGDWRMGNTGFATSGEIRIATTAALTAPTGAVNEAAAIGGCMGAPNATLAQSPVMNLFECRDFGEHPIKLQAGDCLILQTLNPAATGTWTFNVNVSWLETVSF